MMRIAYLIMVHKDPEQLARLLKRLRHDRSDIYLHIDAKAPLYPFEELRTLPNVRFIQSRTDCNWGGFSFVQAIFGSLNEILETKISYSHISLLSGQDYPIRDAEYIYKFLLEHAGTSFISYDTAPDSAWWKDARKRYQEYHFTDLRMKGRYILQKLVNRVLPLRKFPEGMTVYGSSDSSWWTITSDCAAYITGQFKNSKKLRPFLKYCWGTDEFVPATLVMNSPYKTQTINNNLRYIDWTEGGAHPKILISADLEKIKASEKLFARKFDRTVDSKIMDKLD